MVGLAIASVDVDQMNASRVSRASGPQGSMSVIANGQRRWYQIGARNSKGAARFLRRLAGEPGFEPGLTESESVGLPLTYSPKPALGAVKRSR